MSWLVTGGRVLASAEVARTRRQKGRGLLGRDALEGAYVIPRCRWVHTLGMRFAIDVAYLDADGVVLKIARLSRHRVGPPVWHARTVVEAPAGALERWGLHLGDKVELREAHEADDRAARPDDSPTEQRATG
jgi:uncharacterized membrane protein (UPF0127 family)